MCLLFNVDCYVKRLFFKGWEIVFVFGILYYGSILVCELMILRYDLIYFKVLGCYWRFIIGYYRFSVVSCKKFF